MTVKTFKGELDGSEIVVGIVVSRFNEYAGKEELDACLEELKTLGVQEDCIRVVSVPGALEIPLALQMLAESDEFDALIALGAVIRGETYHFEIVSNESASGIMQVGLDFDIPIANAVLTTENDEQAQARLQQKGTDAAQVAVEMANLRKEFEYDMEDGE
jgi:6,7-dimethyl-8-ribityllumazine synthase